jgi:hypothetical protein
VYIWLWRHLPGPWLVKALTCLVLFLGVVVLLFFVVFPQVEPILPWNHTTVSNNGLHR